MNNRWLYYYIILQTLMILTCQEDDHDGIIDDPVFDNTGYNELVDPYSFDYDRVNKKMANNQQSAKSLRTMTDTVVNNDDRCQFQLKECKEALNSAEPDGPFTRRLINLLLTNAKLKENGNLFEGSIVLSGTKEQIDKLQQYGNGKITMRQIDAVLTDVMTPSIDILGEALTLIEHLRMIVYQYGGIFAAVSTALAILLSIKFVNWSTGKVVIIFLALVFLTSYFMIWSQLIRDADTKLFVHAKKNKQPPVQCDPEKMSSWDRIVTYFDGNDQCLEYYKLIDFNPYHQVTPLDALIALFDKFLLEPAARLGSGISHFIDNSTKHLSLPMKWVVTIILYLGVIGVMIVTPFSLFGGPLRLWLGPFFGISMGGGQKNGNQQQLQQPTPPVVERREPITVILQLNSDGGLKQSAASAIVHSVEDKKMLIAGGDSKSPRQEEDREKLGGGSKNCCCKGTSSSSDLHVNEVLELKNESTKNGERREEKGDGDC